MALREGASVKDLGVDATAGTGRRRPTVKVRFRVAGLRHRRVVALRLAAGRQAGRKLFSAGTQPAAAYGLIAYGASPQRLRKLRTLAAEATGFGGHGRCTTTTLAMMLGSKDPAVTFAQQQLAEWIRLWIDRPSKRQRLKEAWDRLAPVFSALPPARRWRLVRGGISATIAVLLQLGWEPQKPHRWVGDGLVWEVSHDACDFGPLFDAVEKAVQAQLWQKAASHPEGRGAEAGVDFTPLRKHLRWLEKKGWSRTRGALATAACGAAWTAQRCYDCGYGDSPICPRCGLSAETACHRVWQCTANIGEAFEPTDGLKHRATVEVESGSEAFWLRGLTPKDWTATDLPTEEQAATCAVGRAILERAGPGVYFVDGSGTSSDKRLRRTGWGVASLTETVEGGLEVWGGWFGGVAEPPFTVPRSELRAATEAVRRTSGDIVIVTDCEYVSLGFEKQRHVKPSGRNGHLRADFGQAIAQHSGSVFVRWTKAHLSCQEFVQRRIPYFDLLGNEVADAFARRGEENVRIGETRCKEIALADGLAWKVRSRIAAATIAAAAASPVHVRRGQARHLRHTQRATVESVLLVSQHVIERKRARLHCTTCLQSAPRKSCLAWLRGPCSGPIAFERPSASAPARVLQPAKVQFGNQFVHDSHAVAMHRGLAWCWRCGAWTQGRLLALAHACTGAPSKSAADALSRLRKGLHPKPRGGWPITEEEWSGAFPVAPSTTQRARPLTR